jgi:hypothetical protein
VAEEKERAAEMGHSVATHRMYRRIEPRADASRLSKTPAEHEDVLRRFIDR